MIKHQQAKIFTLILTVCLCCFASTNILFANTNGIDSNLLNKEKALNQLTFLLNSSLTEFELFLSNSSICFEALPNCLPLNQITVDRNYILPNQKQTLLLFPKIVDLKKLIKLSEELELSNIEQKQLVQYSSIHLNDLSSQWFLKQYQYLLIKNNLTIEKLSINNSALLTSKEDSLVSKQNRLEVDFKPSFQKVSPYTVGILDSGVSVYHQQMKTVDVFQYNPLENSVELKDTGLGHGSGILSLLSATSNNEIAQGYLKGGNFLSCNGLPKGKYNYQLIIQCMNWFFIQPKVDVIINAWLASEPGCKNEWQQPIEALLAANIIPVFSAGNYGNSDKGMNYSPANLILDNVPYPLITVGALNKKLTRLSNSSYGLSSCKNPHSFSHYQANFFSQGENLKIAIPFSKTSYQLASGTSYSIVEVAATIAKIKGKFPEKKNDEIINALLVSADQFSNDKTNGYGQINYREAIKILNK